MIEVEEIQAQHQRDDENPDLWFPDDTTMDCHKHRGILLDKLHLAVEMLGEKQLLINMGKSSEEGFVRQIELVDKEALRLRERIELLEQNLRSSRCPLPLHTNTDETVGACVDAGECGCSNFKALGATSKYQDPEET